MTKIFVFSGTSEGRNISEFLSNNRIYHHVFVATDYGKIVMDESKYAAVFAGRLDYDGMLSLFENEQPDIVIDATHPYATLVTENIKKATDVANIEYIRVRRSVNDSSLAHADNYVESTEEAIKVLLATEGKILLTTGVKTISYYAIPELVDRLVVRILPSEESLKMALDAGVKPGQIIAMEGPFNQSLNESIIEQYNIKILVTKNSGDKGGYTEKINACIRKQIQSLVIQPDNVDDGYLIDVVENMLINKLSISNANDSNYPYIIIAGVGAGNDETMTVATKEAIEKANYIIGAKRMCDIGASINQRAKTIVEYNSDIVADKIKQLLKEDSGVCAYNKIVVLVSGDSGFYSGATTIKKKLDLLQIKSCLLPGISSISYFSSKTGVPYSEATLISTHGKTCDYLSKLDENKKMFSIVTGPEDVNAIVEDAFNNYKHVQVVIGYNLGLDSEKIVLFDESNKIKVESNGLYVLGITVDEKEVIKIDADIDVKQREKNDIDEFAKIMLASTSSGVGKTTITSALLTLLKENNKKIHAFKCGPDYIDPTYHKCALGVDSKNLDLYFCNQDLLRMSFIRDSAELNVIEGCMGLFDGMGVSSENSPYEIASVLKAPIVLIVDGSKKGYSIIAEIKGFIELDYNNLLKGLFVNNISDAFFEKLKPVIEKETKLKVIGHLPNLEKMGFDSRHLGLKSIEENEAAEKIKDIADQLRNRIDIKSLMSISIFYVSDNNKALREKSLLMAKSSFDTTVPKKLSGKKIAVAKDEAFYFYYKDNLDALKAAGASLIYFSLLHDKEIPKEADGLYIGGGYPELYLSELEDNISMRESVKRFIDEDNPTFAECGGFMYLQNTIDGYHMVGVFDGNARRTEKLVRFGYVSMTFDKKNVKGHEFHHYDVDNPGEYADVEKASTKKKYKAGLKYRKCFASYVHLYFMSCPQIVFDLFGGN